MAVVSGLLDRVRRGTPGGHTRIELSDGLQLVAAFDDAGDLSELSIGRRSERRIVTSRVEFDWRRDVHTFKVRPSATGQVWEGGRVGGREIALEAWIFECIDDMTST